MSTDDTTSELLTRRDGVVGYLTLNRPKAIHALTAAMDHAMTCLLYTSPSPRDS